MIRTWKHPAGWLLTIQIQNGAAPVYQQLVDQIRFQIGSGGLKTGEKLPTVRELADALEVNFNTVAKAYHELSNQGLVIGRKGGGSTVAESPSLSESEKQKKIQDLYVKLLSDAASYGLTAKDIKQFIQKR